MIAPSPESNLEAFDFSEESHESPAFFICRVDWLLLPGLTSSEKRTYLSAIDAHIGDLANAEREKEIELWHLIVKNEAIEYYEQKLSEVGIELDSIGAKTHAVFDDLVKCFSLANIYQFIFVTIRNTLHYVTQQQIPKYRAKNMFVGGLESDRPPLTGPV